MKNTLKLRIASFFLLTLILSACCAKKNAIIHQHSLLQVCPEEWIQNKMPSTDAQSANEYFIYEGKRREIKEFDMEWVKKYCTIKPQIVQ
jgi:hypothetical protein